MLLSKLCDFIRPKAKIDVFCIGTPDIAGDAVGPLVGTELSLHKFKADVKVIGTTHNPVTASTYSMKRKQIRRGALVIAIDAAVGDNVGTYESGLGDIKPGDALYRKVHPVGDMWIKCYTARTNEELLTADKSMVAYLSAKISAELIDLFKVQK